jgi:hypothetical protein
MSVSFVLPTRNRSGVLAETIERIAALCPEHLPPECDLIVIDNASDTPPETPVKLPNGIEIKLFRLTENRNTAARNIAAIESDADWLVMLDDDSSPVEGCDWSILGRLDERAVAIGGEIFLMDGQRESGGLPEVVVGCGCAIRRELFLKAGGYDASLGYYAEEYDLCARLIHMGYRVLHSTALGFLHRKSSLGRDFNEIIYRLVRNNAWIMQRYAPDDIVQDELRSIEERYRAIALRECAITGYDRALDELGRTISAQTREPLCPEHWDRFTGRSAVRQTIRESVGSGDSIRLVGSALSKGRVIIEEELLKHGCLLSQEADARLMIGSLSPGPMLDLQGRHPDAVAPWRFEDV